KISSSKGHFSRKTRRLANGEELLAGMPPRHVCATWRRDEVTRAKLRRTAARIATQTFLIMNLTNGTTLLIPLYHGTSTLFLSSISEYGLGGKNPIEEWDVLGFFNTVLALAGRYLLNDDDWVSERWFLQKMGRQEAGASNWRHKSTYLSPS